MNQSIENTLSRTPLASLAAFAFLAAAALYANTLSNTFVFDDNTLVAQNTNILGIHSWPHLFTHGMWPEELGEKFYRPVTMLSYAVQRRPAIGGLNASPYHLVNIVVHAVNAALVCLLAGQLFGEQRKLLAVTAGLLFAVHPIQADAVAPIFGRAELLATLGCLLALRFWLQGRLLPAVASFALGLFSKESAIVLPVLALLCDGLLGRLRREDSRSLMIRYSALVAVIVVYAAMRVNALGGLASQYYFSEPSLRATLPRPAAAGLVVRLATAFGVIVQYLRLLVWPARLSPDYSFAAVSPASFGDLGVLAGFVVFVASVGAAIWLWPRNRGVAFAVATIWVAYALASNLFVPAGAWMAERYLYLPLVGIALLAGLAAEKFFEGRQGALAAPALVLLVLSGRTFTRNHDWHDGDRLWRSAAQAEPRSVVNLHNWGEVLLSHTQSEPAIETFRHVLEIAPDTAESHNALSRAFLQMHKLDEAASSARRALELRPSFPMAHNNLGLALAAKGDAAGALEQLRAATTEDEGFYDAWNNLGVVLFNAGHYDEAIDSYKHCLDLVPRYASARFNYGLVLLKINRMPEAVQQLTAAVQYNPGLTVARLYLAQTFAQMNDWTNAEQVLLLGTQIEPRNPTFQAALAQLYSATSRPKEADAALAEVNRIDPNFLKSR